MDACRRTRAIEPTYIYAQAGEPVVSRSCPCTKLETERKQSDATRLDETILSTRGRRTEIPTPLKNHRYR